MLAREDFNTRTWERVEALLRARLQTYRELNDSNLDEVKTAKVRGRIAEIKDLLALPKADPASSGTGNEQFPAP